MSDLETPDARTLLRLVAERYAEARSYADLGVVTIRFELGGTPYEIRRPFRTAFVRPDRFRFEFYEDAGVGPAQHYIVWQEGERVATYSLARRAATRQESLGSAIAGGTGISGGSAHAIPTLLLPGMFADDWRVVDLEEPTLADGATIVGRDWRGETERITIDPGTLLIRRIEESPRRLRDTLVTQTITYQPLVDVALLPEELAAEFPVPEE